MRELEGEGGVERGGEEVEKEEEENVMDSG